MILSRSLTLLLPLLVLAPVLPCHGGSATAQSPADRALLARYADSLRFVTDTHAVEAARRDWSSKRKRDGDPLDHLFEGLTELRLTALDRPERSNDAAKAFRRATRECETWPWAWYGYGLAQLAKAKRLLDNPLNIGTRVGEGPSVEALDAFRHALALDPSFVPAARELAAVALRLRTPERMERALATLREAAALADWNDAEAYHQLGRLEVRAGDADAALEYFAAAQSAGGPSGLLRLERARILLPRGVAGADSAYFLGAASGNPAAVAGYRRDLQYVAAEEELAAFDAVSGQARVAWLRSFWRKRDDWDLRAPGTRLREHFTRLAYARRHFWLDVSRRHHWAEARYVSEQLEFDDRGIIHIRHGPPAVRVTPFVYAATANESWRYDRADGEWFLHFCAQGDLRDYRLIESALDVAESRCNTGGVRRDQLLMSRYDLSPIYTRIATWGRFGRARLMKEERDIGRASIAEGTTTDSDELRYPAGVAAEVRPMIVGRREGASLVHLVFDLGGEDTPAVGGALRVRAALFDSTRQAVARLDTVIHTPDGLWPHDGRRGAHAMLAAPPGTWTYRVALEVGDSTGKVFPLDSVTVHDFQGGLAVSDLLLGTTRFPLTWQPIPADTAYIDPALTFRPRDVVEVYYEVYGMAPGGGFVTRLEIKPRGGGGLLGRVLGGDDQAMSFQFDETARGPIVHTRRRLDLSTLEDGDYWLEVEVRDAGGAVATRRTAITIEN